MKLLSISFVLALSACAPIAQLDRHATTSMAEAMGTYSAPLMGGSPRPSGCRTQACLTFDEGERLGYEGVRVGRITYVRLVDALWEARRRLWPNSNDDQSVHEYQAFLRVLAEQIDNGRVSAAQWEYLVEQKLGETLQRQRGQVTRCNTTNVGTSRIPNYQTICRN